MSGLKTYICAELKCWSDERRKQYTEMALKKKKAYLPPLLTV